MRRSAASASPRIAGAGPPPIGLASRRPSSRAAATQRYAVERPTAKRRAAVSGLSPASTAASTRLRRSVEYAPAITTSARPYGRRCPDLPAVRSRANRGLAGTGVAAVAAEPRGVLRGDGGEGWAARFVQRVRGAGGDAAQPGLHLGPGGRPGQCPEPG